MPLALQPTHFIPIKVTTAWATADNAAADVVSALEESFKGIFQFPATDGLTIALLQVQSGATEKGVLTIAATTAAGNWSTAFSTTPTVGSVVYLVDMY